MYFDERDELRRRPISILLLGIDHLSLVLFACSCGVTCFTLYCTQYCELITKNWMIFGAFFARWARI